MDLFEDVLYELYSTEIHRVPHLCVMKHAPHYAFNKSNCIFCRPGKYMDGCDTVAYICNFCKTAFFEHYDPDSSPYGLTPMERSAYINLPVTFRCAKCDRFFNSHKDDIASNTYVLDFERRKD